LGFPQTEVLGRLLRMDNLPNSTASMEKQLAPSPAANISARGRLELLLSLALIVAPGIYLFVMMQYSAITYPFWDHLELVRFLTKFHDGVLTFSDLVSAHNQTRPLVYRAIYLANAVATSWDIRSEYAIMYVTIYGLFAAHIYLITNLCKGRAIQYPVMALISVLFFSPVGHNNFWWSMMLQLNMANLLIFLAVVIVVLEPNSWSRHVIAAILGWLAAYTLTNGLFLFISMAVAMQLTATPWRRLDRFAGFWVLNLAVLLAVYLPGIPMGSGAAPSITSLVSFTLAYLGTPVADLIWFPYRNQFDVPLNVWWPALCGAALVSVSCVCLWNARNSLRTRHAGMLVFLVCTIFACVSALATAWGRAAFDEFGVASANSSRYSIFAVYLTFGLIYLFAAREDSTRIPSWSFGAASRVLVVAVCVLIVGTTYVRGIHVYQDSHAFNQLLGQAYLLDEASRADDKYIYPDPGYTRWGKAQLIRLKLGPYRDTLTWGVPAYGSEVLGETKFAPGRKVSEQIAAPPGLLFNVRLRLMADRRNLPGGPIRWRIELHDGASPRELGSGTISTNQRHEEEERDLQIPLTNLTHTSKLVVHVSMPSGVETGPATGLPLFKPADEPVARMIEPLQMQSEGVLGLTLQYVRS
jgi:hypothetical protein